MNLTGLLRGRAALTLTAEPGTKSLHLRKGLTLTIPVSWKVYEFEKDWLRILTGSRARPGTSGWGFREPDCESFWVMGPRAIKVGDELFRSYTTDRPFYPSTDVRPCPIDFGKDMQLIGYTLASKGLRQIGPGHKADYRNWKGRCANHKVRYFSRREWFLPISKVLIIDQWNTPGLSGILKKATWR
ncbi:hypothetical protein [Streptosporangium lutulentum]|uniref:Uncharacterized protein n=1 Tax=Streptosporangium lutulentum TaxID=1461250 RepID=A0ABT9QL16_9ACTN|nr:hypothetical protein [Streptosporangium lutulentum]MDP9847424.1 hypothetical protein [Streptosporangium lutulentum]